MSNSLAAVRRATATRQTAEQKYRAAVMAARDQGHSLSQIADAAGITPQGVRYLLHPDPRKDKAT